jgi:hypothetical protein
MQIKMTDVISLKELYPKLKNSKLPAKLAYKLVRIFDEVDKQAQIYTTMFSEILNDCAQKDENGNPILIENGTQVALVEDKIQECSERMTELNNLMVEFEIKYTLTLDDLDMFEGITLEDIKLLSPFID